MFLLNLLLRLHHKKIKKLSWCKKFWQLLQFYSCSSSCYTWFYFFLIPAINVNFFCHMYKRKLSYNKEKAICFLKWPWKNTNFWNLHTVFSIRKSFMKSKKQWLWNRAFFPTLANPKCASDPAILKHSIKVKSVDWHFLNRTLVLSF